MRIILILTFIFFSHKAFSFVDYTYLICKKETEILDKLKIHENLKMLVSPKIFAPSDILLQRIDKHNEAISGYLVTSCMEENCSHAKRTYKFRDISIFVPEHNIFC